jgi:hypothetical protein
VLVVEQPTSGTHLPIMYRVPIVLLSVIAIRGIIGLDCT